MPLPWCSASRAGPTLRLGTSGRAVTLRAIADDGKFVALIAGAGLAREWARQILSLADDIDPPAAAAAIEPAPVVGAPGRVDTARLRDLLATVVKLEAAEARTGAAVMQDTATLGDLQLDIEASRAATEARVALTRAVRSDLEQLLDEVATARGLLTEVADYGLTSGPEQKRIDLYRRLRGFAGNKEQ